MSSHAEIATDSISVPDIFTQWSLLRDDIRTETSTAQDGTVKQCLPLLSGESQTKSYNLHGVPRLDRHRHVLFLKQALGSLPSGFMAMDATRPWMLFWALTGLHLLGEDVSSYRERVVSTLAPLQNPTGGFGGGHGQASHCAASYAAVMSLILVGGNDAWDLVDRKSMWNWLGRVKQPMGGFRLSENGEEDVRGAYCAMSIITILRLPVELSADSPAQTTGKDTFLSGFPEYISKCQSYEGGISATPGREAHGGYAFCGLACLCMIDDPQVIIPKYIDVPRLLSWLSSRQNAPEGGFSGRTNKLVDGCYAHWVGGCWPIVEAALGWHPETANFDSLHSREGLIRYILCCCQQEKGGLRDKPEKRADSYHSCYVLSGLSSVQNTYYYPRSSTEKDDSVNKETPLSAAYFWNASHASPSAVMQGRDSSRNEHTKSVFDEADRVEVVHPIFTLPWGAAEKSKAYFEQKKGL